MDTLTMDVRQALRALAARPVFTAAAVLTLALGIGGSTAIFGFVSAVLLRPLPYADPDRLVSVTNVIPQMRAELAGGGDYLDWRDRSRTLAAIAAYAPSDSVTLTGRGEPRRMPAARVSSTFLPTLGIAAAVGRNFLSEEDRPHGAGAVLVTSRLWRQLFPDAVPGEERSLEIDGSLHAIAGVLPAAFVFPGHPEIDLLLPLALDEPSERGRERQKIVQVIARRRADATIAQVRSELEAIQATAVAAAPPAARGPIMVTGAAPGALAPRPDVDAPAPEPRAKRAFGFETFLRVVPLQQALVADVRPALLLFTAAVGLLLLLACANTANLLLARAAARQPELAVRAALGAGRGRLARQLLTESAVLAILGGTAGVLVAGVVISGLLALMPPELGTAFSSAAVRVGAADPIGKRVWFARSEGKGVAVVGVVADARHEGLEAQPRGVVYRPLTQDPRGFAFLAVRTPVEPGALVSALRREVAWLDRGLAVHDVATMGRRLDDALATRRFNTVLLGAFGLVALLLSGVGLYGVMAHAVTERTRELGIRIAIGAAPRQVRSLVLRQGMAMAVLGAAVGAAGAVAGSRALQGALYGVRPTDAVTFLAVPVILLAVCGIACELPARRATRVDPAVALRAE